MLRVTTEVEFLLAENNVGNLLLASGNNAAAVPTDHIGFQASSMLIHSLTVFSGCAEPIQQVNAHGGLVFAPVSTVAAFRIQSVKGDCIYGTREQQGAEFHIVVRWRALKKSLDGKRWIFKPEPDYLQQFGVKVEYQKSERSIITAALGYSPFTIR